VVRPGRERGWGAAMNSTCARFGRRSKAYGMHVILMGPQGVGKGTQATRIAGELGLVHVSTGDLFRNAIKAQTPLGQMAKKILDAGELVPDDVTLGIVEQRLNEIAAESPGETPRGALFDGFPRTPAQAEGLDAMLTRRGEKIGAVIEITAPRAVLVGRLSGRRVCSNCGATYHVVFNPPANDMICDACGGPVVQRADDTAEAIGRRLSLYDEQTAPLLDYYRQRGMLQSVDGDRDMESVSDDLIRIISAASSSVS
jgi:adenylate kinase